MPSTLSNREDEMKIRMILSTAAAAAVAASVGAGPAMAEPTVIKIGSFTPPKAGHVVNVIQPWLRKIEADSAGTIKFQEFWGGALIRSPRKQWEGMLNGIQDASTIIPAYTSKLFPDFTFYSLPFLFRGTGSVEGTVVGWKMHERGLLGGLDQVHVASVYSNDNGGLHFNREITSLDQLKGLKVRVPGPGQAAVVKELGLVPVGMGARQVAESINRGVIQGTLMGWSAIGIFRITPLLKSHVDLPMGSRGFFVGIHKRVYDKLPRAGKEAIAKNEGLDFSLQMGTYYERDGDRMRTKTQGRHVVRPDAAAQKELFKKFKPFHDAWIQDTKDGAKKYQAIQEILAKHRGQS
jgi:TRAP-type C4-dicarboxylate transport system substrate-binding protein